MDFRHPGKAVRHTAGGLFACSSLRKNRGFELASYSPDLVDNLIFGLTSVESQPQTVIHMVGITVEISERYFVAATAALLLVLLGVGLLSFVT